MVVPNTPNPVDGGNINNTPGSDNQWQAAIADMANYTLPWWSRTKLAQHCGIERHEWAH